MSEFYVAILARNNEGEVFATVPDLPGANSAAATESEALKLVIEFANDYVRDLVEEGHEIPKARTLAAIPIDPEDKEIGRALVPIEMPGGTVKISISIDVALLARADRAATEEGLTRSGYIAGSLAARLRMMRPVADEKVLHEKGLVAFDESSLPSIEEWLRLADEAKGKGPMLVWPLNSAQTSELLRVPHHASRESERGPNLFQRITGAFEKDNVSRGRSVQTRDSDGVSTPVARQAARAKKKL